MQEQVLIVGAGPTGMVLALWLNRLGVKVRILDKASGPGTTSRAMAVQARTLELYRQLDLADAVVAQGKQTRKNNLWVEGKWRAQVELGSAGEGLTPYPFMLTYPQDRHEALLVERLTSAGITIERDIEVLGYEDDGTHVSARYRDATGKEGSVEAQYIVGCEGAHSIVRRTMGVDFAGGTYDKIFYVADAEASGVQADGEMHIALMKSDFVLVMNYAERGLVRLIGTFHADESVDLKTLRFDDVSHEALGSLDLKIDKLNWFSTYRVHHRVASTFRKGRALIAGDAGHIHSPAGGQGMNTGIGDAINLAWKLAAVLNGEATDALLDTYDAERQSFAKVLVSTTDKLFTLVTAEGSLANMVRTEVFPVVAPLAMHVPFIQALAFQAVSQIDLNYRKSPISAGKAGKVNGGERLPWVLIDGNSNYDALPMRWNVHVYGTPATALVEWCKEKDLPLSIFDWHKEHHDAGLEKDALYLLRPDTYVAFAASNPDPQAVEEFLAGRAITPKAQNMR